MDDLRPLRIGDLYRDGQFALSIEIFPPKTPEGDETLRSALVDFASYKPAFISCTYGAGGSTRARTLDWCREIQGKHGLTATAHFTCVGSSRQDLVDWLRDAWAQGVRNIMALRGDAPKGSTEFVVSPDGLRYATDLISLIRDEFPHMGIGVAGYPEKHPESPDVATELKYLKEKIDRGGEAIYTQLFYDNDSFYHYWEACLKAGITQPIIPGIMPITEYSRIQRIVEISGTKVPATLMHDLEHAKDDKKKQIQIGVDFAIRQCRDLIDHGVPGLHFYVLNKSHACQQILEGLGLTAAITGRPA